MRYLSYNSGMTRFFEHFQLVALVVFVLVFSGRSIYLTDGTLWKRPATSYEAFL